MARRALALLASIAALLAPSPARAGCPGDAEAAPHLVAIPVPVRIEWLRGRLEAERVPAARWAGFWIVVDGALAAAQLAAIPRTQSKNEQLVLVAGAAAGGLGVAQTVLFQPVRVPPLPDAGGCASLAALEAALVRGARLEALSSGWPAHLGNVVVNGLLGLGTALATRRAWPGAVTAGVGWALGTAQILTQPTQLVRDLARYREGELGALEPPAARLRAGPPGEAILSLEVTF